MSPAVRSLKRIRPRIFIPPKYYPVYKVEIIRGDGSVDNVTSKLYGGEVIDGVTDTIGNFTFTIDNSSQNYRGVWAGNEILNLYMDYAKTATTLVFRGRIEQVSYKDYRIVVKGRAEGKKFLEVTVTKSYTNQETSTILTDLISTYVSDFTTTNVNVSTTNITANWYQKPLWDCIQELCHTSGFDCYVDHDLDVHYFESRTVDNTTEAAVHNQNLFEVSDFAYDYAQIKNRVIVYGAKQEEMDIIATSEDTTSQTSYGVKELIINDSNIKTVTQAQERADYELNISKDAPLTGEVTSLGLPTLQPGERVYISAPMSNLNPTYYKVLSYKHKFGELIQTTLTIEKEPKKVYHIIKERIGQEQRLASMVNPNEMRYSWINTFDANSGTHTSTEITNGVLKLQSGQSTGNWVSESDLNSVDVSYIELRAKGEDFPNARWYVSTDNGNRWQEITINTSFQISPTATTIKLKIELRSTNVQIDSVGLLYK